MEMWKCGNIEIWKCGNLEIWECGNMEVWKCGNVEIWIHGSMEVLEYGYMEIWKYGNKEKWKYNLWDILHITLKNIKTIRSSQLVHKFALVNIFFLQRNIYLSASSLKLYFYT